MEIFGSIMFTFCNLQKEGKSQRTNNTSNHPEVSTIKEDKCAMRSLEVKVLQSTYRYSFCTEIERNTPGHILESTIECD